MNYKEKGQITEIELATLLAKEGYKVSLPLIDSYPYDLIVDTNCKLLKVQVKTGSYKRYKSNNSFNIPVLIAQGSSKKDPYSVNEVDLFAIRIEEFDTWYFIPIEETRGKKKLILFPHHKESTEEYFKYRNNFSIFDCHDDDIVQ